MQSSSCRYKPGLSLCNIPPLPLLTIAAILNTTVKLHVSDRCTCMCSTRAKSEAKVRFTNPSRLGHDAGRDGRYFSVSEWLNIGWMFIYTMRQSLNQVFHKGKITRGRVAFIFKKKIPSHFHPISSFHHHCKAALMIEWKSEGTLRANGTAKLSFVSRLSLCLIKCCNSVVWRLHRESHTSVFLDGVSFFTYANWK